MRRRDVLRLAAGGLAAGLAGRSVAADYRPLGSLRLRGAKEAVVGPDGTTVYVATTSGFATVDASDPANPRLLAEHRGLLSDREDGPLRAIQDVAVDGDRLLVVGPAHGTTPGPRAALLYDASDPASPERVAVHGTDFPIHNAFLDGGRAYLTGNDGDRNPVVILDAEEPSVVGRWSPLDHDERWGEVHPGLRPIHDVWVHDGTAFLAYWDAGTWIVDVSDPAAPEFVARVGGRSRAELAAIEDRDVARNGVELPGNAHYCATDEGGTLLAVGEEAWAGLDGEGGPGGIDLWDVSTPDDPAFRSRIEPPPTPDPSLSGTWTTAHNFDLRGGRLYSAWYQGGVKIHDVSDPSDPAELAWWRRPGTARFWTAQRAAGAVVASSMGIGDEGAKLYTFPDRAGTQPDPPSLTPSPTPTRERTRGRTRTGTGTEGGDAETVEPPTSDADSAATAPGETPAGDGRSDTATPGQPGFGALAALAGLGLAARRYFR